MTLKEFALTQFGYEVKTTFWDDFSIAEYCLPFDPNAIKSTYKKAMSWKYDTVMITELALILNWKCWYFHGKGNAELSELYADLYYKTRKWCLDNLTGDDLMYYLETTD